MVSPLVLVGAFVTLSMQNDEVEKPLGHSSAEKAGLCQNAESPMCQKGESAVTRDTAERRAYEVFYLDDKSKVEIASSFESSLQRALSEGQAVNNMFIETHVKVPCDAGQNAADTERTTLVVDIGGTYLKICLIRMKMSGAYSFVKSVKRYAIPKAGVKEMSMWKWVAGIIRLYLGEHKLNVYDGAMTLSYAVSHDSISTGTVLSCGKNFPFRESDFVECNPIAAINSACKCVGLKVTFRALLNDATATALASLIRDRGTILGIVLGTGTNGAVVVPDTEHSCLKIVNTEWGSYEHCAINTTQFDVEIMDEMRSKSIRFNNLDVLIGGYKFVELVQRVCMAMGIRVNGDFRLKDLQRLLERSRAADQGLSAQEQSVVLCVEAIKARTTSILASLVLGVVKTRMRSEMHMARARVCLNGSVFESEYDRNNIKKEVEHLLALENIGKDVVEWDFIAEASLVGCAYAPFLVE